MRRKTVGGLGGRLWLKEWLLGGAHAILLTPSRVSAILEIVTPRALKAMSTEQRKAFWEAVQADAGLHEKLSGAKDADAVVDIAKAAGFVISVEELQKAQAAELSDEELEGVAGGCQVACNMSIYEYCE